MFPQEEQRSEYASSPMQAIRTEQKNIDTTNSSIRKRSSAGKTPR
jgi:hypothetical protein